MGRQCGRANHASTLISQKYSRFATHHLHNADKLPFDEVEMLRYRVVALAFSIRLSLAAMLFTLLSVASEASPSLNAHPAVAPLLSLRTVYAADVPQAAPGLRKLRSKPLPFRSGHSPLVWAHLKSAAITSPGAPLGRPSGFAAPAQVSESFAGMSDSASICPYLGGCQPPDGAIAASPSYVVEGVNTSFAVYQTNGTLVAGWPKNAAAFFKIPSPGSCDPGGAYTSEPRAYYDVSTARFWLAILQVQGPAIGDLCSPLSKYWIAVSDTSDPTQSWHVYSFNMDPNKTGYFADFTQIGFSHAASCFSGNMFDAAGQFQYAEAYCASKAGMDNGTAVKAYGFSALALNGTNLDSIHPVDELTSATAGPGGQFFVGTYNINFGGGSCVQSCTGGVLWLMTNAGLPNQAMSGIPFSTTTSYALPPEADEPGCSACLQTDDVRIGGTPVYRAGSVYFAINSAVNNGSQIVPGFVWQQLNPTISSAGTIAAVATYQGAAGYLSGFGNDQASFYPELVTDSSNNLALVLDASSATLDPSTAYLYRHVLDPFGSLGTYQIIEKGAAATPDYLWGDYNGASWDGIDDLWIAGQYAPSSADWGTWITKVTIAPPTF